MVKRQKESEIHNGRVLGARITELPPATTKEERRIVEEKNDKLYLNLIYCPNCSTPEKKIIITGMRWQLIKNDIYGSITFAELKFYCALCNTFTYLTQSELGLINRYSSISIDKCVFPADMKGQIRAQAGLL
jgi:hypothetical protein